MNKVIIVITFSFFLICDTNKHENKQKHTPKCILKKERILVCGSYKKTSAWDGPNFIMNDVILYIIFSLNPLMDNSSSHCLLDQQKHKD